MTKTSISLIVAGMLLGSSLFAAQANSTTSSASVSPIGNAGFQNSYGRNSNAPSNLQGVEVGGDDIVIPNAPMITPSSIIELSAIGMGVVAAIRFTQNTLLPKLGVSKRKSHVLFI